jgi:hypothetical protein
MSLNPSENTWDELPAACLQVRVCFLFFRFLLEGVVEVAAALSAIAP